MKRLLATILIACLLFATASITIIGASNFSDIKSSDWYKGDLDYIVNDSRHILSGYPDGTYRPSGTLQVDQFIKCVVVAAGHEVVMDSGYWAQNFIDKAISEGYIGATDYSNYRKSITRAEMASIVSAVMEDLETVSYSKLAEIEATLIDKSSIANKHKNNVMKVYELGIITGYPDGTFKPNNTLSRGEATVVLRRIIDITARKPYVAVVDNYEAHYMGGDLWVDTKVGTDEENAAIDYGLIESERLFYAPIRSPYHTDSLMLTVVYDEDEYPEVQLADVERLLSRRLTEANVKIVMNYLSEKTGWYEFLDEEIYAAEMNGYDVVITDVIKGRDTPFVFSTTVEINLWYE